MSHVTGALPRYIPSPPISSFHAGPLDIRFYALGYIIGITLAVLIARWRWRALGGDPALVGDIALWVVPPVSSAAGSTSTSPRRPTSRTCGTGYSPCGPAASASGAAWRSPPPSASGGCAGPASPRERSPTPSRRALLVAQAIGRIGNYFNKELFGGPTTLPWGLEIPYAYRVTGGIPAFDLHFTTFQPTFLYELIWDLALAAFLVWLGHHAKIKPWGLFALYVAGDSAFRIFEESLRIDSSEHFLGLRLNMYIAIALTLAGLAWFAIAQRRPDRPVAVSARSAPAAGEPAAREDDQEGEAEPGRVTTARSDE